MKDKTNNSVRLQTVNPANYTGKELKVIGTVSALVITAFIYLAYRGRFSPFGYIGMFVAGSIVGSMIGKGATLLFNGQQDTEKS